MDKTELEKMYLLKRLSVKEISLLKKCSTNKINYWIGKFQIPIRSRSEALYAKYNPNGDPFNLKKIKSNDAYLLLGLGLGLWWGEGNKMDKSAIRLGNSDPKLIRVFIKFLIEIFGIEISKVRLGLQVFDDQDVEKVKQEWLYHLNLQDEAFFPTVVISPKRGKGTYRKINKFGVVTVYFSNIKLRKILDKYFQTYISKYLE